MASTRADEELVLVRGRYMNTRTEYADDGYVSGGFVLIRLRRTLFSDNVQTPVLCSLALSRASSDLGAYVSVGNTNKGRKALFASSLAQVLCLWCVATSTASFVRDIRLAATLIVNI